MDPQKTQSQTNRDKEVYLTHVFNASREMVFNAWTDLEQLLKWFAPGDCRIEYQEIDVRTGGTYHSCIHDPVHGECWCKGTYLEVTYPERLVFTMEMTDREGNDVSSPDAGKDEQWPARTLVTINFTEIDRKTHLSLHQTVSEKLADRTGARPSWINMLEKLDSMLGNNN
ncbi:SRPBCC family protein [Rubrolithibacter danxiaensis]|uniref:SRPBCC family protein n=1 Tax=Rubrolithibacter danxiaensis TaxID=3390805 RepID=UPI003BF7BCB2